MFYIIYDRTWIKLEAQCLNSDIVIDSITGWECMSDMDAEIIKVEIERYFNEDFIQVLHILIPTFKNCFREFLAWGGYYNNLYKNHQHNMNRHLMNF